MTPDDEAPDLLVSEYDRFAMLPEAVLLAPISAQAVRLFAVLLRYAGERRAAWPARKKLAEKMHCSTDTVDRAVKDLVGYGLLEVQGRRNERGQTSNLYILRRRRQDSPSVSPLGTGAEGALGARAEGPSAPVRNERESGNESQGNESQSLLPEVRETERPVPVENPDAPLRVSVPVLTHRPDSKPVPKRPPDVKPAPAAVVEEVRRQAEERARRRREKAGVP